MRYCIFCEKAMHSSNESVWLNGKNYDAHKKCKDSQLSPKEKDSKYPILKSYLLGKNTSQLKSKENIK